MSIKIIGAGHGRTGTTSLANALEMLGFGPCYHAFAVMKNPSSISYWQEIHATGTTDFETLFDGYQATVDYPGALVFKEILAHYPDAKVILTIRDTNAWYDSVHKTLWQDMPRTPEQKAAVAERIKTDEKFRAVAPVFETVGKTLWGEEGFMEGRFPDREFITQKFEKWTQHVKASVPADQLLIYRVRDGWEPLCKFLGVPVPSEEFPRLNSAGTHKDKFEEIIQD